ncbi:MAG: hypothetical protein BroJett011_36310 [Chloroflexota bacterium]|nr:MAG: hypothetical protein BroJett011_36310 [Chloroflexota bacterium]
MQVVGSILSFVGGIGSLICWIMVLIKMFPAEGALKGILAIICSLYAFIWGWINAGRFNLRNVMLAWTVCIVLAVIGGVINGAAAGTALQQGFNGSNLALFVSVAAAFIGF